MGRSTETGLNGTRRTMSREATEVGAFTWSRIQRLHEADATAHWQRCDIERLKGGPEQMRGARRMRRADGYGWSPGLARSTDYDAVEERPEGRPRRGEAQSAEYSAAQ